MKRYRFIAGLLLTLAGFAVVAVAGLWKPPIDIPYKEWKMRIAPVHLAWMLGGALFLIGLIVILKDTFSRNQVLEDIERQEMTLRREIVESLPRARLNQEELNELIGNRYGRTGLVGLNLDQLQQLRDDIVNKITR